jgi:hypothetical protein
LTWRWPFSLVDDKALLRQQSHAAKSIHTNKVTILKVESVEFVAGLLCVHHFLIDYKCSAFGVIGDSLTNLTVAISKVHTVHKYIPNRSELAKEFKQIGCRGVVAMIALASKDAETLSKQTYPRFLTKRILRVKSARCSIKDFLVAWGIGRHIPVNFRSKFSTAIHILANDEVANLTKGFRLLRAVEDDGRMKRGKTACRVVFGKKG